MAEKKMTPLPVEKPVQKGYLRAFTGWSTAYPPGLSDPTTLRKMSNVLINEDGSLRIRPGLRHLFTTPAPGDLVGSFEPFFASIGGVNTRCILFAYRLSNGKVRFLTASYVPATGLYKLHPSLQTVFPDNAPENADLAANTTYVKYVQIDNKIMALSNGSSEPRIFYVDSSPRIVAPRAIGVPTWSKGHKALAFEPTASWISGAQTSTPTKATATADTLVSSDKTKNIYNWWFFYTFSNEVGETPGSQGAIVTTQRPWNQWEADASDDSKSADQLAIVVPEAAYTAAVAKGATRWNLYYATWSGQNNVPVEGTLVRQVSMIDGSGNAKSYSSAGWTTLTPLMETLDALMPLPNSVNRFDYSNPPNVANGTVLGDRLILVHDNVNPARIHWTGNYMGDYLNFSPSRSGGYKTLTSGNLRQADSVVLWQIPQSTDTITILCRGINGDEGAYYMSPNTTVSNQSQTTVVMGFEETNGTAGTVAPFGVEVLNNALYHPLDNYIIKSTAQNYSISHSYITDTIKNVYSSIPSESKAKMVSSYMDSCLYYLVASPTSEAELSGEQRGTQIWVCDTKQENAWSCWDVPGQSLRKVESKGELYMAVVQGPSIFLLDPEYDSDDVWADNKWTEVGIPWQAVTNTLGANKQHDAWAHVQQMNVTFGNFTGECEYGLRGKDVYGNDVEVRKHYVSPFRTHDKLERFDNTDFLLVRKDLKEWEFFWESASRPKERSYGCVSYVQFMFSPRSINVGYEYGSVETLQYGELTPNYPNGIPSPFGDVSKP